METNLRPLTLGEILDRTAELYRTNFILFAGIFAVYCGVALILNLLIIGLGELLRQLHMANQLKWVTWTCTGLEMLVLFLLFGAAVAAISRAVAWVHLGQPATIRGSYMSVLPNIRRYLWLMTITAFVIWTPMVLLYGGYFALMTHYVKGFGTPNQIAAQQAAMSDPKTLAIIGISSLVLFLLMIPIGVYTVFMSIRYALALPACVVERIKARAAIRRAIDLSKGSRGRIFVLGLLIGAIKIGFLFATQFFVFIAAFKHPGQPPGPGLAALSQVIAFFTNTFLGPVYATGITLFYYDQRIRKEGFDIEWMMQAAGLTAPTTQPLIPAQQIQPTPQIDGRFDQPPAPFQPPIATDPAEHP